MATEGRWGPEPDQAFFDELMAEICGIIYLANPDGFAKIEGWQADA